MWAVDGCCRLEVRKRCIAHPNYSFCLDGFGKILRWMIYFLKCSFFVFPSFTVDRLYMQTEPQKETFADEVAQEAPENSTLPERRPSSWSVLRNRNYGLLFWGQMISSAGTQMQVVAVAWQVYLLTHSAIALGVIGLVQAVPRLLFSLIGGVFADALDRRKLLMIVNLAMMSFSTILGLCTDLHMSNIPLIYVVVLLSAAVSSFEYPTRQAIVPTLVPRDQMADALSL